jgi:hypothetical protein
VAVGCAFAPHDEAASARRLMVTGSLGLLLGGQMMERRLGAFLAEPYNVGRGAALKRTSGALSLAAVALGILGRRNRSATRIAAACAVAAGVLERFAVVAAGKHSAKDPQYTVTPQRARAASP